MKKSTDSTRLPYFPFITGLLILLLTAASCHHKPGSGPDSGSGEDNQIAQDPEDKGKAPAGTDSTQNYYPVADYFRGEIRYVDSTPLGIRKYLYRNKSVDSSFIQPEEFNQIAREFLLPALDPEILKKYYTENSFQDETTGYITLHYAPRDKNAALPLQRIDVVLAPAGNNTSKARSIYMEAGSGQGDSLERKKLYWETHMSFQIIRSRQAAGKQPEEQRLRVVWDGN